MTKRGAIDWKSIEADYRAGTLSVRKIATKHAAAESAVRKKAKAEGWQRAESAQPRNGGCQLPTVKVRVSECPEGDVLSRARREAETLLSELEETRRRMDEIEDAIEEETRHDSNGRRRAMMMKAISLPSRTLTLKTLTQAINTITEIDGVKGKKQQQADKAKEVAGGRFAAPSPPKLVVDNR